MNLLRSLRVRLLLMFMFVVIVTLATVAFAQQQATSSAFQNYTNDSKRLYQVYKGPGPVKVGQVTASILDAYRVGNLKDVQAQMVQVAVDNDIRVILVDGTNRILYDSAELLSGNAKGVPTTTTKNFTVDMLATSAFPVMLISTTTRLPAAVAPPPTTTSTSSPGQDFLNTIDHSLWLVIVLAWLLALVLTITLSNHILKPVRELTRIAHRMEEGDLGQRIKIRTKDEIGALAHAFNTMAESLARSEQLRRNLISDVAHELRTPLTNIRGYLEALQDRVVEPTSEIITSLYEESLLLNRMVVDLQELSLAEAGQLYMTCKPLAIKDVIVKAVYSLQLQAASKELLLQVDIASGLPPVEADAERIGQVLRNLLSNAIRYTPSGGTINISAYMNDNEVQVSVQDTGEGIDAQHLPYIFERFYRADSSRTRATGGTGLGLAIVKQVVQAHGGRVEVESVPGEGSCFMFTLPAAN